MAAYTKLFHKLLKSSVWTQQTKETKLVWITMLASTDRDGVVESSVPGLARDAGVTLEECKEALRIFMAPDQESTTKDNEGRKIEEIPGVGWRLLNFEKYRDMMSIEERREYYRKKQAEYRAKLRQLGNPTKTGAKEKYDAIRGGEDAAVREAERIAREEDQQEDMDDPIPPFQPEPQTLKPLIPHPATP